MLSLEPNDKNPKRMREEQEENVTDDETKESPTKRSRGEAEIRAQIEADMKATYEKELAEWKQAVEKEFAERKRVVEKKEQEFEERKRADEEELGERKRVVEEKLAEEKQAFEKDKQKLEEEKEEVEKDKQKLEEEKEEVEKDKQKLEEEKEEVEKKKLCSLSRLFGPETNKNYCPQMILTCAGHPKSHTEAKTHQEAYANEKKNVVLLGKKLLERGKKDGAVQKCLLRNSNLLTCFEVEEAAPGAALVKSYVNESDISEYVMCALRDAVAVAKAATGKKLDIRHECSLFSVRPDHLVVYDSVMKAPILIVEDKKPIVIEEGKESREGLTEKSRVIGQVYDYIVTVMAFANFHPFAVLTTFDQSIMLWQDNQKSNDIAVNKDDYLDMIKGVSGHKPEESPPPPTVNKKQTGRGRRTGSFIKHKGNNRKLARSIVYDSQKLVELLYTALVRTLARNPYAQAMELTRPNITYEGEALKLTEASHPNYCWGTLVAKVGQPIDKGLSRIVPFKRNFYVIGIVGSGITSKIYLALDDKGDECVIKMYANRYNEEKKFLPDKDFNKLAKEMTTLEARKLKKAFPILNEKVSSLRISGQYCVVMPYFDSISKADRKKKDTLDKIEKALNNFHKNMKKKYKEGDRRWSHVGWYKNQIILFDLANLDEINAKESTEEATRVHMTELLQRAGGEKEKAAVTTVETETETH